MNRYVKKSRIRLKLQKEEIDKETHVKIIIDDTTTLENVPKEVLEYQIGSKNPLEWILEFYKESKNQIKEDSCNDKAVRDRFNAYRFADHKEELITLIKRVTTVCVETMRLRQKIGTNGVGIPTKAEIYHQDGQIQEGQPPSVPTSSQDPP